MDAFLSSPSVSYRIQRLHAIALLSSTTFNITLTTMTPPTRSAILLPNNNNTNIVRKDSSSVCGTGRINQIFILTCIASLLLQLYGSLVSWHSIHGGRRLGMEISTSIHGSDVDGPGVIVGDNTLQLPERLRMGRPRHSRRLRVLFGILTADFRNDEAYRKRHRALFKLWNDKRVCSLHDFKKMPLEERYECELIYTFVIAANPNETAELVDHSRPYEVSRPYRGKCNDLNQPDMTLLNIKCVSWSTCLVCDSRHVQI